MVRVFALFDQEYKYGAVPPEGLAVRLPLAVLQEGLLDEKARLTVFVYMATATEPVAEHPFLSVTAKE
jgi:hypothetical protein